MDWANERYVRLYTRDTPDWAMLSWQAQAIFCLLIRKADRTGMVSSRAGVAGVAALLRVPPDVMQSTLLELLADGCVEQVDGGYLFPNFIPAQEASMTPALRQRESRERRRDQIRRGMATDQCESVVYFIQAEHGGPIKIGHAEDLATRLAGLQVARPDPLVVLASCPVTSTKDERVVHRLFAAERQKGEWFTPSERLLAFIADLTSSSLQEAVSRMMEPSHETRHVTSGHSVPIRTEPSQTELPEIAHASGVDLSVKKSELEEVYRRYPRKQGKTPGLAAALTKVRDRADYEALLAAVDKMAVAWAGADLQFCPHFSTFIRQTRWRDESLPLPGTGDRWTRPVNTGHAPAPPRDRFQDADEDDIGDLSAEQPAVLQ